ncbi:hypothetical protein [Streptomyces sp. 891-h]|uniref:hypothetical protein n=1 Tax=unclassified Streptomyces TaxID=2593676 RepID=UPI001FA94B05|nr:hypothetical protein [Streptomyces sp. 891-h]
MHRGGGLGEGPGPSETGPERAQGRHRRTAAESGTTAGSGANSGAADGGSTGGGTAGGHAPSESGTAGSASGSTTSGSGIVRGGGLAGIGSTAKTRSGRGGGRVGVTYKYFGAPDGATAARVPISMRPEELGGDELGQGMFTKIKPETMAAMVLTGIEGIPLHRVPPLELVVLHPDYAVVKLPMTVVDPLRGIGEESVGAAAFIWSTVPDRAGPQDAFNVYQLLHRWQDFSDRLHEAGHQAYCLVWP